MRSRPRVFWALNHTTLAKYECALLEKLGCEVLTPKICPAAVLERSGSVDHSFDRTLTIPAEDLAVLNACDFYAAKIEPAVMALLNRHFDAVFVAAFPGMIEAFQQGYEGLLILRAFGREKRLTYASLLDQPRRKRRWLDRFLFRRGARDKPTLLENLVARRDRFLFGGCYREVIDNEPDTLRAAAAYLPLGLPADSWATAGSWTGGDDRLMFVCPCVHNPYYGDIYAKFRQALGTLPFVVYGNQAEPRTDGHLAGFLPRDVYEERMRRHAVMFYHSSEACHLHYHPLEAVAMGMPLVYMAGGMLERLGGPDQPGLARSWDEARQKLRRILEGDQGFVARVRASQGRILDEFRDGFVEDAWRRELLPRLASARR